MFSNVSVSRVFSALLVVMMLIGSAIFPTNARADSIVTVNSTADTYTTDGLCTLREAITNANAVLDTTGGDCIAGSGNDTIIFASSLGTATITLASTLPNITDGAGLTIDGDNRITLSGNDSVQVLRVDAVLTLQNISVTHGSAIDGGGLYNLGTLTIIHSIFSNNSATDGSGGGVVNAGTATILNSTFSDNSATVDGGGVGSSTGTITISNSTFSNNSANTGGGVSNISGTATILNSTFSGNSATTWGGGVGTWNGGAPAPTTTISNTILANNLPDDCWNHGTGGAVLNGSNNIIETTSTCISIATLTSDPNLGSLTGSPAYFPLIAGSPAIDAGDDAVCAAAPVSNTSQNGLARPQGMHCDIGSVEAAFITSYTAPAATGTGDITASFTGGGAGCSYSVSQYIPLSGHAASPPAGTAPAGFAFPHGLFDFTTSGCTAGSTITMVITYPQTLPPGTVYWKYGPTPTDGSYHWYQLPAVIAGNTATFSITDGGLGDDDLTANGTIVDQGGPGVPVDATAIPTLSEWALLLLAGLMGLFGVGAMRRREA